MLRKVSCLTIWEQLWQSHSHPLKLRLRSLCSHTPTLLQFDKVFILAQLQVSHSRVLDVWILKIFPSWCINWVTARVGASEEEPEHKNPWGFIPLQCKYVEVWAPQLLPHLWVCPPGWSQVPVPFCARDSSSWPLALGSAPRAQPAAPQRLHIEVPSPSVFLSTATSVHFSRMVLILKSLL